ncbi:MAG: dihydroorotate dehydrogenase-like protein [Pirellulaceae bacterium]|jgi:dihydroorotate dehydrogenase (fumarate)|nr:dihydroorotate dehydrogenase-like protein [Pirellulaceae bacterium]
MSIDLSTNYLGLSLRNPLVVAACPLCADVDALCRLEEAGAAAAVLPSLFEEQIEHDEQEINKLYEYQTESYAESLTHFPEVNSYNTGTTEYLQLIETAKKRVHMPLIGSLNGASTGGWTRYAKSMQDAGVDAMELNIYFIPTDPQMASRVVEDQYAELAAAVKDTVSVPLSVKIGPFFTSVPAVVQRVAQAGADGLVLFNRFLEPDIDLESLRVAPNLVLSSRHELRLALRWIAIVRDQTDVSLAATGGVHFADDVIKALLAGADVVQMATALLRYGPPYLGKLLEEVTRWLEEHEYTSVAQMKGSLSRGNSPDPSAFERANYMKALTSFTSEFPSA